MGHIGKDGSYFWTYRKGVAFPARLDSVARDVAGLGEGTV